MPDGPTVRGFVLVVGPDGAGKSTVVDKVVARLEGCGAQVSRAHHRPGVVAGRPPGAGPVTDPHAEQPRSTAGSLAKLAVVFADHVIGGQSRWRIQRRHGLLLLERGWFDMAVDPCRYRLPARLTPVVRILGRALPRPDVVLLLTGEPAALHARKPEIGVAEVDRQTREWRETAPRAGWRVVEVDTVHTDPDTAVDAVLDALTHKPWRSVPLTPKRIGLRVTGQAGPALAVYQPQSTSARAGAIVWRTAKVRGRRRTEPVSRLDDLWRAIGVAPDGVAAMNSSMPGRWVLSLCQSGKITMIAKIGLSSDLALRHEAKMLSTRLNPDMPVGRPQLVWCGEWRDKFVVVTSAVHRISPTPWTVDEVVPLVHALATAGTDGCPLIHGDVAPWNLMRTVDGPVLLDWEFARWADEPLHDLSHFVVQVGALLGRYAPEQAISLLCDEGSPGWRLLRDRDRDTSEASPFVDAYLTQACPTEPRAIRFRDEMVRLLSIRGRS